MWLSLACVSAAAASSPTAHADGVAQVFASKSIPPATVALIDPESGTSSGGGTTDVRIAPGDIVLFRFRYSPVPDKVVRGIQGYLTEYVPSNTRVVGVRFIDADGLTIPPRHPGIAVDGCARPCNGFNTVPSSTGNRNLNDGSIAQLYADTGVFYTTASSLARVPGNAFITLVNGTVMNPEPRNVSAITGLLGASSPIYAHNAWDWLQVRAFGTNDAASENKGTGNTPFGYGSPVAGPQTFYPYTPVETSPGVIRFDDTVGPWARILYPGSQTGTGAAVNDTGVLKRVNVGTSAGLDVTPANPLPADTKAIRYAMGEVRVGEPAMAEIALRVEGTPLDPGLGKDADCAEVFGGDTSAASDSVRGKDNPWPTYLGSPACVYLNLLFDLDVDKPLATGGEVLTYSLRNKNLSVNPQTGVVAKLKFNSNEMSYVAASATGNPTLQDNCDGDGKACLVWPARDMQPSDEYTHTAKFTIGGIGHVTNVMFANYRSNQLAAPGFTTQALTLVREISVVKASLASQNVGMPGGTVGFAGNLGNAGSGAGSFDTLTVHLPAGWSLSGGLSLGGVALSCASGCGTATPTYTIGSSFAKAESRALAFTANVPGGAATGLYPVSLQVWSSQSMFGGSFETFFADLALAAVGAARSAAPTVTCPIGSNATAIRGTTTGADGTVIRLYFNGIERGSATAASSAYTVNNFAAFGPLYGGLEVRASAQAPGELESEKSTACFVSFVPPCSDEKDNDSDGLTDFPADPGCESPMDGTEADPVYQCSDGVDNDGDMTTDHPNDLSCMAPNDNTEAGPPTCSDGMDNDGDGLTDHPADPGCESANDPNELTLPACADGVDNDGDGTTDFPADVGCHAGIDDDEVNQPVQADDTRPRLLLAFDTSGSMNWNTCQDVFTGGDGSGDCTGADVACATCNSAGCGDGIANDSRLYKVKAGTSDAVRAFGEVDWALMRFHQRSAAFMCPVTNASLRSGGWQGAGFAPCGGGFSAGDLLVSFAHDNRGSVLRWMDGASNYDGVPPPGQDIELRGSGTTPLAGILMSALAELQAQRTRDPIGGCRPYRVVLITDGAETCGGDAVAAAAALFAAGIRVQVIGFATPDPAIVANLDAIANAGGTSKAVRADDAAALSAAITAAVAESVKVELCNEIDDDCDGQVDEDFVDKGKACANGMRGLCERAGTLVCGNDQRSLVCNAQPGTPGTEACPPNGQDDDCNGIVDDVMGGCQACTPEVCNGRDDDCDGATDELDQIFPCPNGAGGVCPPTCGTAIGVCTPGTLACTGGMIVCQGGTGPMMEACNGVDDDCNGVIDGFARRCYPDNTPGCNAATGECVGICRFGSSSCPRLDAPAASNTYGACFGAITPQNEICNGVDDDCDGTVDDVPGGCDMFCIPTMEVCNGKDDDCDGVVDDMPVGVGDACVEGFDPALVGKGTCKAGKRVCVGGMLRCEGAVGPSPEICDGKDNDCDEKTDTAAPCPDGFSCAVGTCTPRCGTGEFPCPPDRLCAKADTFELCANRDEPGCSCLPNPCVTAKCNTATQDCVLEGSTAKCVDRCRPGVCRDTEVCQPANGRCFDCRAFGCAPGQICTGTPPACVPDPCAGVSCGAGEICAAGVCRKTCANVNCPDGQICSGGTCRIDACRLQNCSAGTVCNPETGMCQADLCRLACPGGQSCVPATGACVADVCVTARCPACSTCTIRFDGTPDCVPVENCGETRLIEIGSAAACGCDLGGRNEGRGLAAALVGVLALAARVARRRRAR